MPRISNRSLPSANFTRLRNLYYSALVLLSLPFIVVSFFLAGWILRDLWMHREIQAWIPVRATLLDAKLESRPGRRGRVSHRATAQYRYDFDGQTYESDHVSIHSSFDRVGTSQQVQGGELERLHKAFAPVTAYVDPSHPSRSILFRDLRPGLLSLRLMCGLAGGLVGFTLAGSSLAELARSRRKALRQRRYKDQPWRWDADWQNDQVITGLGRPDGALLFAFYWNLMTWPIVLATVVSGEYDATIASVLACALAIGAYLAIQSTYSWLQRWKWGTARFEMSTTPGVIGGSLIGAIRVSNAVESADEILIHVCCTRYVRESKHTSETVLWEEEQIRAGNALEPKGRETLVPVSFLIPHDLPESADDVTWSLSAFAETRGIDFQTKFEFPVVHASSSTSQSYSSERPGNLVQAPLSLATIVDRCGGAIETDSPEKKVVNFPMFRHSKRSASYVALVILWIAVCIGLFYLEIPRFVPWFFIAFAAVLLPVALCYVTEQTQLEFGGRGVKYIRRIFGIGHAFSIPSENIERVAAVRSDPIARREGQWHIELRTLLGARHVVAMEIPRQLAAKKLAEEIAAAVGLSQSRKGSGTSRMELESELPTKLRPE